MNISAVEARKRLGELLNRVILTDEEITIERSGKEVARLTKIISSHIKNLVRAGHKGQPFPTERLVPAR